MRKCAVVAGSGQIGSFQQEHFEVLTKERHSVCDTTFGIEVATAWDKTPTRGYY